MKTFKALSRFGVNIVKSPSPDFVPTEPKVYPFKMHVGRRDSVDNARRGVLFRATGFPTAAVGG
jgi:hypothetical protein